MNVSGIVVTYPPERLAAGLEMLRQLPGIEIHYSDPATGRVVITQELDASAPEEAGLSRIQALPEVLYALLVYQYSDDKPRA